MYVQWERVLPYGWMSRPKVGFLPFKYSFWVPFANLYMLSSFDTAIAGPDAVHGGIIAVQTMEAPQGDSEVRC